MSTLNVAVIDMLFQSSSISKGIEKTLDYLGDAYMPDYIGIAELKGESVSVNYEWINTDSKIKTPDALEYISMCEIHDHFYEKDVFYRDDFTSMTEEEQKLYSKHNISAVLECALKDVGKTIGYMVYFWCDKEMAPELIDVYNMHIITKLISENIRREIEAIYNVDEVDITGREKIYRRMAQALKNQYSKVLEINGLEDTYIDISKDENIVNGEGIFTTDIIDLFEGKIVEEHKDAFYTMFDIETLRNAFKKGRREIIKEFAFLTSDGKEHWYGLRIVMVEGGFDKDSSYFVCIEDINEEKQKQITKDKEMNTAIVASRSISETKGTFLSTLSHDIRTPMNNIMGMTSIAKKVIDDREKALECLSNIETASDHLIRLLDDMLDMSRFDSGEFELSLDEFDIDKMISDIDILMRPKADEKVVSFEIEKRYIENIYIGDKYRLNQVLVSFIANALNKVSAGDKIKLKVEQVAWDKDNVFLRFSVKNSGKHMSRKTQEQIFKAFEMANVDTVKQLGDMEFQMVINNKIVSLMGGHIGIDSREGCETDIYFTVPLKRPSTKTYIKAISKVTVEAKKINDFSGKRALVAEDEDMNADTMIALLEVVGFKVDRVKNGKKAVINFISKPKDYYDTIFLDAHMPIMDGLDATKCIRISGKDDAKLVPIIGLIANTSSEIEKKALSSGMNVQVSKPVDVDNLYNIISQLIEERIEKEVALS